MPNDQDLSGEFVLNPDEKSETATAEAAEEIVIPKIYSKAGFLSNLVINPENVTFETQDEDEQIVLLVRRDLITNVPWITFAIVLIAIPPIIASLSSLFTPFFSLSATTQLITVLFYYLIVFGFILIEFVLWYFNIGLVTTKRVIDLDVFGILSKHLSETRLNIIEDVSYNQVGSIRTVFNYGDVILQTAGTSPNFEFDRAPEPVKIVRVIADMIGGPR